MKNFRPWLLAFAAVVIAAAVYWRLAPRPAEAIVPEAGFYYTGPMKSKSGSGYGTPDGRAVAAPNPEPR